MKDFGSYLAALIRTKAVRQHGVTTTILVIAYSILFLSTVFVNIEDVAFMKVDPASITESIYALFEPPYYNMLDSYHSRYYGWTYFFINFIALAPLKLFGALDNPLVANFSIRLILFLIGLSVVVVFYFLLYKVTKNRFVSFLAAVLLMTTPAVSHFWYTIHPESTGILFFLFGLMYFLKYREDRTRGSYYKCMIFLMLSSLAKQPFFIMSLFVVAYLYFDYCRHACGEIGRCIKTKEFRSLILKTVALAFVVLVIIHPYAILKPAEFLMYQVRVVDKHTGEIGFFEALGNWSVPIFREPVIVAHITLMLALFTLAAMKRRVPGILLYSVVSANLVLLIFMAAGRYFFSITYMGPLYPVFILNLAFAVLYFLGEIAGWKGKYAANFVFAALVAYPLASAATLSIGNVLDISLMSENTAKRKSWDFVKTLPVDAKLVYDPTVALPPEYRKNACHIWRRCRKKEFLESYSPDYFVISPDYAYMNKELIFGYIDDHGYCPITYIEGNLPPDDNQYIGEKLSVPFGVDWKLNRLGVIYDAWKENRVTGNKIAIYERCERAGEEI